MSIFSSLYMKARVTYVNKLLLFALKSFYSLSLKNCYIFLHKLLYFGSMLRFALVGPFAAYRFFLFLFSFIFTLLTLNDTVMHVTYSTTTYITNDIDTFPVLTVHLVTLLLHFIQ